MARQRELKTIISKKDGKPFEVARRDGENAICFKSLFLDLDVKPGAYASTTEAVKDLVQFCKSIGMPRPTLLVKSGSGGLHVYWVLDRTLTVKEWKPSAQALVTAATKYGLKFDPQCTIDAARVLRIPNTFNRKSDPPKPVEIAGNPLEFDYPV